MPVNEPAAGQIRALLIDDHTLFRQSVAQSLSADPSLSVEHCASIRDALTLLSQRSFDLVLLDHDLGAERASQFLPAARQIGYEGRVLVVTAWVSDTEARAPAEEFAQFASELAPEVGIRVLAPGESLALR